MRVSRKRLSVLALAAAFLLIVSACGDSDSGDESFTIGVSNTLVGNGWRE